MKHRAAGRLARKRARQRPQSVFAAIGKAFNDAIDSLAYAFTSLARTFRPEPTQADFVLSNPPLLVPTTFDAWRERMQQPRTIGPEDWPTETELQSDLTRTKTGRPE
jgi:hypothetical protein